MPREYDQLDLGCGDGGFIRWARGALGVRRCLGVDWQMGTEAHRARLRELNPDPGVEFEQFNVAAESKRYVGSRGEDGLLAGIRARIVTMSHFLEHLPGTECAFNAVEAAAGVASEFVMITGPAWDCEPWLRTLGMRFYWSEWADHTLMTTTTLLEEIARAGRLRRRIYAQTFVRNTRWSGEVVMASAPRGSAAATEQDAAAKPEIRLDPPLFATFTAFMWRGDCPGPGAVLGGYDKDPNSRLVWRD